uniref:FAT atypical cadherin 3a n=1 Tax=Cyprinus carpio TaxID=7962 RepID=A0A8C1N6L0_CYPCA
MALWAGIWAILLQLALLLFFSPPPGLCQGERSRLQFTQPLYHASVYENSAARTYAASQVRMGVPLQHHSWEVRYRITSGDEEGFFKAEDYTLGDFCFLRIRTKGGNAAILNREVQDNYLLTVKASIKGDTLEAWTKVSVQVLDMNDLRPLFSPTTYSVTIAESTPLRTSIAQVTATDADIGSNGEFYYFFKERMELFAVHPTSGVVSLSGKLDVDTQSRYDLEIQAVDRGMKLYGNNGVSSTAKLFVHVERINEHVPTLNIVTLAPDWTEKSPVVAVVTAEDLDEGANGEIEMVSIVAGDLLELFSIERTEMPSEETGDEEVKQFDWDSYPYGLNLSLQARDRGTPQKFSAVHTVHLQLSRPAPAEVTFQKDEYEVLLSEVAPPGTVVEAVKLQPEPDDAEYILTPSADSGFFNINTMTGVISTARWVTQLTQEVFELEVLEVDSDLRVKVRVILEDANDNAPSFAQQSYEVFINESVAIGTAIVVVTASDGDHGENGYITYSMASLTPLPFSVQQFTGAVMTTQELDFESSVESFSFVVRASDWGSPYRRESEVNVTVHLENVNDNKPLFEKVACVGVISREFPVGEVIATMSAIDIDELELVKYKILSGNEQGYFDLNPDSGVMTLRHSLNTAAPKNSFSLKITATDGEHFSDPMFVNISVVQGKSPPKSFSCTETRVAQRLAEKLLKKAKVSSKPKMEEGFIDLFSVNRQTPQFDKYFPTDITVSEDVQVGMSVFQVKAFDGDTGFNGQLLYAIADGNTDSCFTIGILNGIISIFLPLDRERTDRYLLNITLHDLGQPQRSSWRLLTVYIADANDNAPQFLQDGGYQARIAENTPTGTEVIQVEATDKDQGLNGEIQYSLLTSTSQFGINSSSGIVYVAGQLDRELVPYFILKVEARDRAERAAQQFSVTTLKISLKDVNDCPPAFIPSVVSARALEDLPVGTVIAWLDTQDPDLGHGGQVRYSLANDYDGHFEVDKTSGAIRLTKELDYETQQFFNLTVRAKDKGRPVSLLSVSFVELEVVDVNENLYAPYFSNFAMNGSVKESVQIGTSVLQVSARDDDMGRDGEVQYSIRDGTGLGRFTIDEETGVIYTTDLLDRETQDSYWLTVYATDLGVVPQSTALQVYIQVEDVNDNAPLTSEPMYHATIPENSPKDQSVIQIQAQDPDATATEPRLSFRISSGNPQNFFSINPRTGLITTTSRKLDREQQAEHVLEVTVSDGGLSPRHTTVWVVIQVLDVNDNKPTFPEKVYQVRLPERTRKQRGAPIYRVFAYDQDLGANAELSYSIVDGNEDGKFVIDAKTGVVSSPKKQFTAGTYDILTVKAVDNGRPQRWATARLHIEWIRRPPPSPVPLAFDEQLYNFTVMETDKVADIVGVVSAQQQGSASLWFDITGGDVDSMFDVEKGVGTIVIAKPLDAEQRSFYNLTVEVTDGTNIAYTQVHITVLDNNDNAPIFSQPTYDITITEDTPPDTEVVQVLASDRDERHRLTFSLQSSVDPSSIRLFRIDPNNGIIYTARRLDHESRTQHILTIMVKDQEFPYRRSLARVLIGVEDVNDHAPLFTMVMYDGQVYESAALGSAVLTVTALDKDKGQNAQITYSIDSGNTGNTFRIDPVLGIISLARELDLSNIGHYVLSVKAMDNGSPALSSTAVVRIAVTLSDNAGPKFPQSEYQAEISEGVAIGTSVITVNALSLSTLTYDIRHGNGHRTFRINQYSGVITTQKTLDFETVSSYVLIVTASNMAGQASNATITVTVLDENDNAPLFQQLRYHGSISEGAGLNSVVQSDNGQPLVIRASDADRNHNALLVYQIMEESARRFFAVDAGTGSIRTIAQLDHETTPTFSFHVNVRDSGHPQLSAERPAEVTIEVQDVNDSPPKFSQDSYEAVLLLPTYEGVEALKVFATDPDGNGQSELTYSLTDGSIEHFSIEPSTGLLTVRNSTFSKERFRFNVRVSDGRFSSTALVTVMVHEALDSGLAFTHSTYNANIEENNGNITTVAVVTALGNKLNEPLRYTLLNAGGKFRIRPTSGAIETVGVPLDREEKEEYGLLVQAGREEDRLRVARALVRVQVTDVNDNSPVFVGLPYYAAVQVEAEPGTAIFQVTAVDRDKGQNGEVNYFLQDELGHFEMDRVSGELRLRRAFEADLSSVEYQVLVFARDMGMPPLSSSVTFPVTVVNRAMPVFDRPFYSVKVSEDIPIWTPILGINASSPEGQSVLYTITHGDPGTLFSIGFDTGVISVIAALDYETSPSHKLIVRATDCLTGARAEVDVEVTVLDVNDNPPVFEQPSYKAVISESAMIGTAALQVLATDSDSEKNAAVRYQIIPDRPNSTDHFHIDSSSGLILTARSLDHETIQRYVFLVKATDNGFPPLSSEVWVTVDVTDTNDNAPVFNQLLYEASISELAPKGHFVTCIQASDADRSDAARLQYGLVSGNERMLFELDAATGVLTLSGQRRVQRMPSTITLNVSVSDGVFTSTAQVHIRVERANLHAPQFTQGMYEADVRENAPVGSKVIAIRAQDSDPGPFGDVRYVLLSDAARDLFSVDGSGQITTLERLDREEQSEMVLSIAAVDAGGRSGYCSVRVTVLDENDNAPLFGASEYHASVRSEVEPGTLVTQVQAWDLDQGANGQVSYSLYSEASMQVTELLDIDSDSGWVVTKGNFAPLRGSVLSFFVKASDGGTPVRHSLVSVYIHVLSADAHIPSFSQPQFSFTVPEDMPIGSLVGAVHLHTSTSHSSLPVSFSAVIGQTLESNSDGVFVVDKETGMIKLDKALDRELTTAYHFKVMAMLQQGRLDAVSAIDVEVKVQDVNDNKPSFESDNYEASVTEGLSPGTRILQVRALDPDWAANGQVTYSLAPPGLLGGSGGEDIEEHGAYFTIDSSSGWISTLKGLDHEQNPAHSLTVWAFDLGDPASQSSSTTITIAVSDSNDNIPQFLQPRYYGSVRESDAPGEVVAVLNTRDNDSSPGNRQVTYHITGGNRGGVFALGLVQGEWKLYVKRPLDREEQERYLINVTATDGLHVSTATVEVTVIDTNDNSPVCEPHVFYFAGVNRKVVYSLVDSADGVFSIDKASGIVVLERLLDREVQSSYLITVRASDQGVPVRLSSLANLTITVLDINDNPPSFQQLNVSFTHQQENKPLGTSVLQLSVIDNDASHNGPPFHFHILSGNEGAWFKLDREGLLTSNQVFRRSEGTEYVIHVQASDSGRPPLSSMAAVLVRVIEESVHKPVASPLHVHIVTMEDEFPGGVIGQIHATDQDAFDILTYGHTHQQSSLFKVSPRDGRIIALSGLDTGRYTLSATVTDGRFTVNVPVSVHVEQASAEMLHDAVTIRFDRVSPHDFVSRHLPSVRRVLSSVMATPRPDALHVLSVQPVESTGQLDLLVAVETAEGGGFYKAALVTQKLSSARRQLDQVLRVSAVLDKNCSGLDCREAQCEQTITLDSHSLLTYSSTKTSFVSPKFHRNTRCVCSGDCSAASEVCADMRCPGDMQCVGTDSSRGPYMCQCPQGKLGECAGHTSLSFSGNSYIKYRVTDGERSGEMKLALRIRTLQSKGIIMYTRADPCSVLKIEEGKLWFQLDCGNSPRSIGISGRPVNDGNWHHVVLELRGNYSSLSLDDMYVERRLATTKYRPLGADLSIYFGAQVSPPDARSLTERKGPRVTNGFQGCLDSVVLNDNELPLQNKRSPYAEVVGLTDLKLGCVLYPDACAAQPCVNGATCVSLPSGGYSCSCSALYTGGRCETEISVCLPNPCQNGGVCKPIGNAFICSCKRGYTGATSVYQHFSYFGLNYSVFDPKTSHMIVCLCLLCSCEEDVNECERELCENGGVCVNTFGSFYCNCTPGFVGSACSVRPVLVPDMQAGHAYVGKEELIGIAVVLFLILTLILLFIAFRKKVFQKKPIGLYMEGSLSGPPQVPVRPMAYTPCFPGDTRGTLERRPGDGRGMELTEMSTFHPSESPRILGGTNRRGVVVCSVAPNLPPISPCRSDCDSLRKSPWEEEGETYICNIFVVCDWLTSGSLCLGKVDLLEEVTCFSGSNKGSNSEVQSLSSFQSDSCDDNGKTYHWDTSDWLPSTRLPDIEEVPTYETVEVGVALESDYYLGGFDIDSDYSPPQEEEFMSQDQLPPPLPTEEFDTSPANQPVSRESTLSGDRKPRPHFHPSQYLPPHQLPLGSTGEEFSTFTGRGERLSINVSSASDVSSVPCGFEDSETGGSLDSLEDAHMHPHTQQTEV